MTDTTTRCPRCSALLAPEAAWCGLCFLDLRPAPEPEPEAAGPVETVLELPVAAVEGTAATGAQLSPLPQAAPTPQVPRAGRRFRPGGQQPAGVTLDEPADAGVDPRASTGPDDDGAALPPGVEAMLAQLAVEEGGGKVSLGPLDDAFSTPGRRAGVMAAGALALTLVLFLLMWVLGRLLG